MAGASSVAILMLTFVGSLALSFLVGGGTADTAFTMPVMAPLGDFAGVDFVVTTWAAAAKLAEARPGVPGSIRPTAGVCQICQLRTNPSAAIVRMPATAMPPISVFVHVCRRIV